MDTDAGDMELEPTSRQMLAAELRRLRDLEGISGRDLARRLGISQSKVSRIEAGSTVPSLPEVMAWLKELSVACEVQERLVSLTEAAYTEVHPWRAALHRRGHLQNEVQEVESLARQVQVFQPSVVPGLLQIAEYARRVCSLFQVPYSADDLTAAVASRLDRQLALYEPDQRFEFLITEAALRWRPGPPRLLLAQLDRVASVSTLENVSIGLIPLDVEAVAVTSHGFVIYDGDDEDQNSSVSVETVHAKMTVNSPEDIELYRRRWQLLRTMAVFDDEARRFLTKLSAEIAATG